VSVEDSAEGQSSESGDYAPFLLKVAHVPDEQVLRAKQRGRIAALFEQHERFALQRFLGAGSFGLVYEALDRQRGCTVALKVLASERPERLFLFKREFRVAAGLTHENLASTFELFSLRASWFFTMELVEGRPLLSEHAPRALALARFLQLARGLSALHELGLLHRDLKPSNVLVDGQGRVVVVDFGLAKALHSAEFPADEPLLRGMAVGTPGYVAPEVLDGAAESRASDWFSFGVMLHQALTGLPARASWAEREDPRRRSLPKPAALGIALPAELEGLCMALLSEAVAERPPGAAVIATLTRALGEAPEPAAPREATPDVQGLLARAGERALLHAAHLESARAPRLVLFTGPRRVGKSALLRTFQAELGATRAPPLVLATRCAARERIAYSAFDGLIDALARELLRVEARARADLCPPELASALAGLFPVMGMFARDAAREGSLDPSARVAQALGALRLLLARLMRHGKPVVMAIDDLHAADAESAHMLASLLESTSTPFLIVASACSTDATHSACLRALLPRLGAPALVSRVSHCTLRVRV
jgi:hypothetical protein